MMYFGLMGLGAKARVPRAKKAPSSAQAAHQQAQAAIKAAKAQAAAGMSGVSGLGFGWDSLIPLANVAIPGIASLFGASQTDKTAIKAAKIQAKAAKDAEAAQLKIAQLQATTAAQQGRQTASDIEYIIIGGIAIAVLVSAATLLRGGKK